MMCPLYAGTSPEPSTNMISIRRLAELSPVFSDNHIDNLQHNRALASGDGDNKLRFNREPTTTDRHPLRGRHQPQIGCTPD